MANIAGTMLAKRLAAFHPFASSEIERSKTFGEALTRRHPAGFRITSHPEICQFLLEGWAAWHQELRDGRSALSYVVLPGELIFSPGADRSAMCLTNASMMSVPAKEIFSPAGSAISQAILAAERQREHFLVQHVVRLGRMDAAERIANFLCELQDRMSRIGLLSADGFALPMTQEEVGDLLGLSTVHVNRTYKLLRHEGLARVERRRVDVLDLGRLAKRGQYVAPPSEAVAGGIFSQA